MTNYHDFLYEKITLAGEVAEMNLPLPYTF